MFTYIITSTGSSRSVSIEKAKDIQELMKTSKQPRVAFQGQTHTVVEVVITKPIVNTKPLPPDWYHK